MTNQEFFSNPSSKDKELDACAQHQYWCNTVVEYTHRGMTRAKDRLVALAGPAHALCQHTESEYLAGLWSQYLWAGILWNIPHTHEYIPTTKDTFNLEDNKKVRHKRPLAPSWSWASVTAPVVYASPAITSLNPICEILSASTSGTAAVQTGRIEIRGHVRTGYVNPVYPFAIQEALERHRSHMMLRKPQGQKDRINFKGRAFSPNDYFLFSKTQPEMNGIWGSDFHPTFRITTGWDWRFVRGTFRPDEIISTTQEITFVAIAQQHVGRKAQSLLETNEADDPLRMYTLALVPTGENTGEYRRVGYAVWSDCAWYGYMCGKKQQPGAGVERPGRWTKERGWEANSGFFDTMEWWMRWANLEYYKKDKKARHMHDYDTDVLPELKNYHRDVGIEEKVLVIM